MALPVTIPNTFATATSAIPLSQLDANFNTLANVINDINSGAQVLANLKASNVEITGGIISNVTLDNVTVDVETLSNVTINGGNVTVTNMVATTANATTGNITTVNATTVDTTNIEVTNIKAKDGTAAIVLTDSTGAVAVSTPFSYTGTLTGGTGVINIGSGQVYKDASGNVGIGTSSPTNLSVYTSFTLNAPGGGNALIDIQKGGTISTRITGATGITDIATDVLSISTGSFSGGTISERMRIDSSGNVGIGTTSPGYKLQVTNSTGINTELATTNSAGVSRYGTRGSGNAFIGAFSSGKDLEFWSNGSNTMLLDSSGNLGLGVTPSAWRSFEKAIQVGTIGYLSQVSTATKVGSNNYYNSTGTPIYITSAAASIYVQSSGSHQWFTAPSGTAGNAITFTQALTLDANRNLLLNGTSAGASAVGTLAIFNGTAPTGSVTNGIILYAEDVSSSSELKVRDEAGNVTTLSPHNFSMIPEGPSEDMAWAYYSERNGKKINVDMLKLARMVEKLTGEKLVYTD